MQNWTVQEFSQIETTHVTRPRPREGNLPAPHNMLLPASESILTHVFINFDYLILK